MSNHQRGHRPSRQNKTPSNTEETKQIDDSPLMASFRSYSKELDDKHDRYERIVKISRDITIESKRIIFLLHTIDPRKDNRDKVLLDAEKRIAAICENNFLQIAKELSDLDQFQYVRAFSAGLQEFIEAYTFLEYLKGSTEMFDWDDIQCKLKYQIALPNESENENPISESPAMKSVNCFVKPVEFMLGLADVGGEIMRRCINSLGSNDIQACFQSCRALQSLYAGYLRIGATGNRDMPHKVTILRQSTLKTENVCYNIKIRGTEAAQRNAVGNTFITDKVHNEDEDEGFY